MSDEIFRYTAWVLIAALGAAIAYGEKRMKWFHLAWIVFVLLGIGGYVITRMSPFTFSGGDYYIEGVILWACAGLLLVGYVAAVLVFGAIRMFGGGSK